MKTASQLVRHFYLVILCAAFLVRSEAGIAQEQPTPDIATRPVLHFSLVKSENDQREYRYLVLENKLRVLLISDATTEKSAAAMDVFIGHNQDPEGREGLAHLLEHMLLLGSKKYPTADEYQKFIGQHDGRQDAVTTAEHTRYLFDINSAQLEPALDRFAHIFIAPLLSEDLIAHQRSAIHADYLTRLNDESQRILDVYRDLINPAHPSAKLSIGNLENLMDRENNPIHDDLLAFHQQHYSAMLMTLVVLGREPLDKLQEMVVSRFREIPAPAVKLKEHYPPIFPVGFLPAAVSIKPESELRQLSLLFPIPDFQQAYHQKPWHYIGHLLGHEGKGSVLSLLKDLGWAEGLSAGMGAETRHDAFFHITIDLTEKGIRARDQIIPLLFYMIKQIETRGLKDWRYNELSELGKINFRFQEKDAPIDRVRELVYSMHVYAPQDVLRGGYLFTDYNEKLIRQSLAFLRSDNLLTVFISPTVKPDNSSLYFQTPYAAKKIALKDYEIKPAIRKRIFFPDPNAFIPKRLAVKSQLLLPTPDESAAPKVAGRPQLIVRNNRTRAWYKQDRQFQIPKANIYLRLKLPLVAANADGAAQAQLFAALVTDELNEFSYPARLAGLDYSVRANTRGLDISISGYSSRQGLLLSKIAKSIRQGRFSQDRFDNLKKELIRTWRNENEAAPYIVLARQIPVLHYDPYWRNEELIAALSTKTLEQFHQFTMRLLRDGSMDALLYGNFFRQEAIKLAVLAEFELLGPMTGRIQPAARVLQLTARHDKPWLYRHKFNHPDNVVQLYVQSLYPSLVDTAHMKLLQHVLQPAFLEKLRTEKQLGYVVGMFPMALRDQEGSIFVIQSPTAEEETLVHEIDVFLDQYQTAITNRLAENKSALVYQLNKPANSLAEQADSYWTSVLLGDTNFDRREQLANAVVAITPESISAYYRAVMLEKNRRLWLSSQKMPARKEFNLVDDVNEYRAQQESLVYP